MPNYTISTIEGDLEPENTKIKSTLTRTLFGGFVQSPYHRVLMLITFVFVVWSLVFIHQSTFVIEGQRYFSLSDDGMVSMRYAARLVQGRGLTWNDGLPIEGFTNFLMMLFMASVIGLFGPYTAILVVQICGIFWIVTSAGLAYAISKIVLSDRDIVKREWGAVCVFAMTLAYYPIAYWSLMGMETGLLSVLTLASLYLAIKPDTDLRDGRILSVLIGLCFWTRADALVLAGPIWLYHIWKLNTHRGRALLQEGAIIGVFILSLSAFRLWYFGSLVPNSYLLKIEGVPLSSRITSGLGFIQTFIFGVFSPFIYICVSLSRRFSVLVVFCLTLVIISLLYQIWAGGDVWPYWRMLVPVMPIFFMLIVWSFQLKWLVTIPAITAFMLMMNWSFLGEIFFSQSAYQIPLNQTLVTTALALDEIIAPNAAIAVFHAGIIPYYSPDRQVIDCLGKSDSYIARLIPDVSGAVSWNGMMSVPGHNKYDLEYCIGRAQPVYTEYMAWGQDDIHKSHPEYQLFTYKDVELWLNTQSNKIRWDLVNPSQ